MDKEEIKQQVDIALTKFQELLSAIAKADERILVINKQIQDLTKEIGNNSSELSKAIGGIIFKNIETVNKAVFGLRTKQEKEDEDFIQKTIKDTEGLADFKNKIEKLDNKNIDESIINLYELNLNLKD